MNPTIAAVMRAQAVFHTAVSADHESLSNDDLLALTRSVAETRRQLDLYAAKLTVLASRKEAHTTAGARDMTTLIAQDNGLSRKEAREQVKIAETLDSSTVLRTQMTKTGMSSAKVAVITQALEILPDWITEQQRQQIETALAEAAPVMTVEQLRRKAKRAVEVVDVKLADDIENAQLAKNEATQERRLSFWMSQPDRDGMVKGRFEIDILTADILRSVIEAKTSPRQHQRPAQVQSQSQAQQLGGGKNSAIEEHTPYRERAGQAFGDILRHLPTNSYGNHGGVAATLMVTVTEDALRGRTNAAGTTEHGHRISAGQLRQIACTSGILPAIMNGKSQILDLGTTRRLHTPAQRIALAQRDQGCAFPGCDRPPGWCETHHIKPWSHGGATTLDNGVLLCGRHHRHIHNSNWEIRLGHDKHPEFIPPKVIDPARKPRRNHRYQPLVA